MMVDCRGLIEFCKAFEQHQMMANSLAASEHPSSHQKYGAKPKKQVPFPSLCERSSAAAVDVVILLLVLGACGFLFTPYFTYICVEAAEFLPITFLLIGEIVYHVPVAYIAGSLLMFGIGISGWEFYKYKARKCNNPRCRGLKKAMEFDIQLESEQCIKSPPPAGQNLLWTGGVELGEDHKELEAELRQMAPPNGRAVLVFRAPCGCPMARMEVWGTKKARKLKKG